MLPCMHLSTTSSHMNNVLPNVTLDALGLNPVIEMPWSGVGTPHPTQPHGNYSEMFMYNAVKNNEPSFCRNLNISRTWHSIYENNTAACNSSGYSFHAFKITTSTKLTHQVILMLGNALCETLNFIRLSNNTVHVEKDKLFWLTQSNCVWADIVGDNKAQEYLLEKLGDTANTPNVYDQNKDLIHSHFCPNILPSELNQILGV